MKKLSTIISLAFMSFITPSLAWAHGNYTGMFAVIFGILGASVLFVLLLLTGIFLLGKTPRKWRIIYAYISIGLSIIDLISVGILIVYFQSFNHEGAIVMALISALTALSVWLAYKLIKKNTPV